MPFAKAYLEKVSLISDIDRVPPSPSLSIIVTIPACNEPDLLLTLESLASCTVPDGDVEIIIVLNSGETASSEVISQNILSSKEIREFAKRKSRADFRIMHTNIEGIRKKDSGAGYARKIAMDHALSRFSQCNRPDGIIVSLDADTLCDKDYLTSIEQHFKSHPESNGCSIYFEHPLEGTDFPDSVYHGITEYELHMRYYVQGMRYAGHPHSFHTVGSAFCIRAETYASQGGMSKRSAGEDFYFLQKVIPLERFTELNSTRVIPSPRPSGRVAFGTGATISQFQSGKISHMESYNPGVFRDLNDFLSSVPALYDDNPKQLKSRFESWPVSIQANLEKEYLERLEEIRTNSAGKAAFIKRFFRWFNMFRALKYINFAHEGYYLKLPVRDAVIEFLNDRKSEMQLNSVAGSEPGPETNPGSTSRDLLIFLRKIQRGKLV